MSFLTKLPQDRYDPSAFADCRAEGGFNSGTAKAMAWASQLAYETDDPAKITEIGTKWGLSIPSGGIISEQVVTPLPKASTQVIVAHHKSATIVAFAGTDPLVLADWITDFDIGITPMGTANGFTVAAEAVWHGIRAALQAGPADAPIMVTGHSLGGALAVLTANAIKAAQLGTVSSVYTFGMPRVGNPAFVDTYNSALGSRTYRIVHGDDVVPTVAPSFLGFRHVGQYLRCDRSAKFDGRELTPTPNSDEPQFVRGVSKQLKALLHGPLSSIMSVTTRFKLAAALTLGMGPGGMRTDPGGIIIELLPPPLRDHMPDRYIEWASRFAAAQKAD